MSDKPGAPPGDLPDIHFGEYLPLDERDSDDGDIDPESEEYIAEFNKVFKELYDIDPDELFDDDGQPKEE